jgi:hypothetical protein
MTTKPWLQLAATMVIVGVMAAKLRQAIRSRIPVGYQDETGFHFGREQTKD